MKSVKNGASGDFTFFKVYGYDPVKYFPLKIVDEVNYASWITALAPRTPNSNECYSLNEAFYNVDPLLVLTNNLVTTILTSPF